MTTEKSLNPKIEFIKVGNRISPKPNGIDYNLINGQLYDLLYDDWSGESYLKENGALNLPLKIYESEEDKKLKNKIIERFNKYEKDLGAIFTGVKGTGKTMFAKIIAKDIDLPIIVVNPYYPCNKLIDFFKKFTNPCCIIFDEVEKNFNTSQMLGFLDGIEKTAKKLVLMTCNDIDKTSEFIKDRCSRIRYMRKYTETDNLSFLPAILEDKQIINKDKVLEFVINRFKLPSIDNINAFLDEVKEFESINDKDIDLEEIIKYMNIELKN